MSRSLRNRYEYLKVNEEVIIATIDSLSPQISGLLHFDRARLTGAMAVMLLLSEVEASFWRNKTCVLSVKAL